MTYATKHIDWLSVTLPSGSHPQDILPLCEWHFVGRGLHGYQFKYKDRITGAVWQEGSAVDEMGCHLQLSGEALNMLRSHFGGDDTAIVRTISDWHAYASRIDLTLNIHEGQLTPRKVYEAFKSGKLTARTKTGRFIEGINGDVSGDTFYLGSPKSDRQFRAYNKSAELGIVDGEAWLRLELELRNLRANSAYQSSAVNGVPAVVTGHMEDFLCWTNQEFRHSLQGPTIPPVDLPRKQTNRQRWLLGQVAQALANEIVEDVNFRQLFDNAVQAFVDETLGKH